MADSTRDGTADFDFQAGTWEVQHRRLRRPLSGSDEWYEFDGTCVQHPIWNGAGNFEEHDMRSPLGRIHGCALRLYSETSKQWSIYWASSTYGMSPVATVGAFDEHGLGEFFDRETFEGKEIVCRYRWIRGTALRCRWEQAYSADDGATWETNWTMDFVRVPTVVELRRYELKPGERETLIELFDREFVEPQEVEGAALLGQFRVAEDTDQFFWLRGFADIDVRDRALRAFYGGSAWKAYKDAANATMIDSDNVLLLKPARPFSGISLLHRDRDGSLEHQSGILVATIVYFPTAVGPDVVNDFEERIAPLMRASGGDVLGAYVTEPSANTFPALPVRDDAHVFVWFAAFPNAEAYRRVAGLRPAREARAVEVATLSPTSRSRIQ